MRQMTIFSILSHRKYMSYYIFFWEWEREPLLEESYRGGRREKIGEKGKRRAGGQGVRQRQRRRRGGEESDMRGESSHCHVTVPVPAVSAPST